MLRERMRMAMVMACAGVAAVAVPALLGARGMTRVTDDEILARLRDYLRIDTSNPPATR
jgi:uncharacterized membrane protein (DUF2068 family)